MNTSLWLGHFFQSLCAAGFLAALCVVFNHVRKTTISDKYGIGWVLFLSTIFFVNIKRNWFSMLSLEMGGLILAGILSAVYVGILLSIRFTAYSRIRRYSIQEVALLRFRYEEIYKKMEAVDSAQTLKNR